MASVIYVFHIASLYHRRGDGTEGIDMIGHSTKLVLHLLTCSNR